MYFSQKTTGWSHIVSAVTAGMWLLQCYTSYCKAGSQGSTSTEEGEAKVPSLRLELSPMFSMDFSRIYPVLSYHLPKHIDVPTIMLIYLI